MSKKPKVPDKPLTEIMALRADAEFKEETMECAAKAGAQNLSEYLKTAVEKQNHEVKNNVLE